MNTYHPRPWLDRITREDIAPMSLDDRTHACHCDAVAIEAVDRLEAELEAMARREIWRLRHELSMFEGDPSHLDEGTIDMMRGLVREWDRRNRD